MEYKISDKLRAKLKEQVGTFPPEARSYLDREYPPVEVHGVDRARYSCGPEITLSYYDDNTVRFRYHWDIHLNGMNSKEIAKSLLAKFENQGILTTRDTDIAPIPNSVCFIPSVDNSLGIFCLKSELNEQKRLLRAKLEDNLMKAHEVNVY